MKSTKESTYLSQANDFLRNGKYALAASLYQKALQQTPELQHTILFNIELTKKRLFTSESSNQDFDYFTVPTITQKNHQVQNKYPFKDHLIRSLLLSESESKTLRNFGSAFLGPIISTYFLKLATYLGQHSNINKLNFLAREGYLLGQIYEDLAETNRIKRIPSNYLLCSRTILFKLSLSDKKLWEQTLNHHFSGTLKSLLLQRFHFTTEETNEILEASSYSNDAISTQISLPTDKHIALGFFQASENKIYDIVTKKKRAYSNYLNTIGFGTNKKSTEHILDIGYAGTIQKTLSSLIPNTKLCGHYFITTKAAKNDVTNTFHGHLLRDVEFGSGHSLLDRSLYMETLLTAPHGQVVDVESTSDGIIFKFGKPTKAQLHFHKIEAMIAGATDYVKNAFDNEILWNTKELDSYYKSFVNQPSLFPKEIKEFFEIDDSISGLGTLNPIHFFNQ